MDEEEVLAGAAGAEGVMDLDLLVVVDHRFPPPQGDEEAVLEAAAEVAGEDEVAVVLGVVLEEININLLYFLSQFLRF